MGYMLRQTVQVVVTIIAIITIKHIHPNMDIEMCGCNVPIVVALVNAKFVMAVVVIILETIL